MRVNIFVINETNKSWKFSYAVKKVRQVSMAYRVDEIAFTVMIRAVQTKK